MICYIQNKCKLVYRHLQKLFTIVKIKTDIFRNLAVAKDILFVLHVQNFMLLDCA
jgi:hypothetical protein